MSVRRRKRKRGNKSILFIVVVIGILAILVGTLMPREIEYTPRTGMRAQILLDLDKSSSDLDIFAEGITSDKDGLLYIGDNAGKIYRIDPDNPRLELVGIVPGTGDVPPMLLGLAFSPDGDLFIATGDAGEIWKLDEGKISSSSPGKAIMFSDNLTFTNDIAFDNFGRLLTTSSQRGDVWEIDLNTGNAKIFANAIISRNEDLPFGANGIAVSNNGDIFVANTGDGAINIIETDLDHGRVDAVFIWRKDPRLIGADGIRFDAAGNLWVLINARNTIIAITPDKEIIEVSMNGNTGPLEMPASLTFAKDTLYITNFDLFDGTKGDRTPGIGPSIAKLELGIKGLSTPP